MALENGLWSIDGFSIEFGQEVTFCHCFTLSQGRLFCPRNSEGKIMRFGGLTQSCDTAATSLHPLFSPHIPLLSWRGEFYLFPFCLTRCIGSRALLSEIWRGRSLEALDKVC